MVIYLSIPEASVIVRKNDIMTDIMVRVPKALQERYERLEVSDSWKSFPAFVRDAIRQALDKYENQQNQNR
jgi:Arc/MetJ-type ribon-helix-helix transcriptional regulator